MIRIVLVEPEHGMNIGACARAMKNFGFTELWIVKPKAKHLGGDAIMYSKHAREVLENARVVRNLAEATKDCDYVIATTGIVLMGRNSLRDPITPRQLAMRMKKRKGAYALVFGREGTGLSKKELASCDFVVSIPTSKKYPVMNLSHALAVVLYELRAGGKFDRELADKGEKRELMKTFNALADSFAATLRNPENPKLAFRRVMGRSLASQVEISSILCVLKRALKSRERNKGWMNGKK